MQLYLQTLGFSAGITAPIFILIFLGGWLKYRNLISAEFVSVSSRLVFNLALPALLFVSIVRMDFQAIFNPGLILYMLLATFGVFVLLWWAALRWFADADRFGVFVQGAFRSNLGIIGLALCANMYGQPGLALGSLCLALVTPLYNILSVLALNYAQYNARWAGANPVAEAGQTARGEHPLQPHSNPGQGAKLWLDTLRNPLIIAIALALPLSYARIQLPDIFMKTADYLAAITLPLALLGIGASLSLGAFRQGSSIMLWAVLVKIVLLPLVLTLGAYWFGYRDLELGVMFLLFASPTAAASFVMVQSLGGDERLAANVVVISTLCSLFSLSMGVFLLRLWGLA